MPPSIVTDRIVLSDGLSVGLSLSEPWKNAWSDRDTVCIEDSGRPRETPITYNGPLRGEYCISRTHWL